MGWTFWLALALRAIVAILELLNKRKSLNEIGTLDADLIKKLNVLIYKSRELEVKACEVGCTFGGVKE